MEVCHIKGAWLSAILESRECIAVSVTLLDLSVYYQHTTTMLEVVSCPFSMRLQWNLPIMDTPNKAHLSVKDTCCCPTIVLCVLNDL